MQKKWAKIVRPLSKNTLFSSNFFSLAKSVRTFEKNAKKGNKMNKKDDYQSKNSWQKLSAPPVEKKSPLARIPEKLDVINDYSQM